MMAGSILDATRRPDGRVRLWCIDPRNDGAYANHDECGILVELTGPLPALGDEVWWQGHLAYWTPADGRFRDRPLRRFGPATNGPELRPNVTAERRRPA